MKDWWQRCSLRIRLAVSFTLVASVIMLGLMPLIYVLIERQMQTEMDQQLKVDWDLIDAHLELSESGGVRWKKSSPASPSSPGYAETWFDVWADGKSLLSHWPTHGVEVTKPPGPTDGDGQAFFNIDVVPDLPARTLVRHTRIEGKDLTLRVLRNKTGLRYTLRQIMAGLALSVPLMALFAAVGGNLMAGRMLAPIGAMAEQARQITSESLGRRLPNPNPHDELGQLATVFNDTLERLEDSFASLRQFTADASHELRTPLTALRTEGEVALRESKDPEALRDTIGSMLEEVQRLNDLTDALLFLARAEGRPIEMNRESVVAADLLTDVCESVEVLASDKGQAVEIDCAPGISIHVDRLLMRQVVMGLLHNAIRYSPEGGTIRLRSFTRKPDVVIEIADEGPGIAAEHHQKIFERFYRIDHARSRSEGGAGLGLAIAKMSIEQHGGRIDLISEEGEGSIFQIILPMAGTHS